MTSKERAHAIVDWWLNDKRCGAMGPGHLQTNLVDHIAQEIDAAVEAEREKASGANRVILSCYRAFRPSSDYVKREAKRLADEWVQEMEIRARGTP